jgi:hypothetical protein
MNDVKGWTRFRSEFQALHVRAREKFVSAFSAGRRHEAEEKFYFLCLDFENDARDRLAVERPDLDVTQSIAWHIVAGSTGMEFNDTPLTDLPDNYSLRAFLQKIESGELRCTAPRTKRRLRTRGPGPL